MEYDARVDATKYPPKEKHPVIFKTFDGLASGQTMELTNDHDPRPLYYQFAIEREGAFDWKYLEEGPETWRVAIAKR
nr:DUF2249 domain-containing protein [Bacillus piscicola]